jgi:hypothetical protein
MRASTVCASTTVGDGFSSAPPTVWLLAALIAPVVAVLIRSLGSILCLSDITLLSEKGNHEGFATFTGYRA